MQLTYYDDKGKIRNISNLTIQDYLDVIDNIYFKDKRHSEMVLKS